MDKQTTNETAKLWLKRETQPYNARVAFLTVLTVLSTLCSLAFAYMVRYVINSAAGGEVERLWIFSACLLALILGKILLKTLNNYFAEKYRSNIFADLRVKSFSKILQSNYAQIHEFHSGELLNRLTTDVQEIAVTTVGLTPTLVGMCVQCVGAVVALLTLDPLFTLIYVVCGGIFGGIVALFRGQIKKKQKDVLEQDGKVRSFMQEGLSSVLTLKAYGAEEKTTEKADSLSKQYYDARMKRNELRSWMGFVFNLLSNFGLIFAVVWCSISILNNPTKEYGSMLSVILLLMQFQTPLTGFSTIFPSFYSRLVSAERLAELEQTKEQNVGLENVDEVYESLRAIQLRNVDFSYGRECIFSQASAEIPKNKIVCLTGPSGAGKSTVFKLLLSVYTQTSGEVVLSFAQNEQPLTADYRSLFAYVPQGNFLFSGTIYENLTFFAKEIDGEAMDERIKRALHVACAEFVYELPDGLNTVLYEGGDGLSEGQIQRLAVARAILSNRPILLLDEATSALDGETENAMLENIKRLQGKTCIIVTHRPAALEIADCILNVENGKINIIK